MSTEPLTLIRDRIAARIAKRREDPLVATAHVVEALTDRQARIVCERLLGRPLLADDADLLQLCAQRIGEPVRWMHVELKPGAPWLPGRKDTTL
jgi:predicted nucleic acid-binding protein